MQVGVTIICKTYNHGKYIAEALDGFVKQKTSFPFRVILHDDASTDNTVAIVREYESKYPHIITGIYQEKNLYSQGKNANDYILPLIQSKYVAICEGDDCWIDETKLQQQYDALEAHPECTFCVHRVKEVKENGEANGVMYPPYDLPSGEIDSRTFVKICENYIFHTSSFFARANEWIEYSDNPPEFRKASSVGDVCTLLYFGQLAKVYYIDTTMSFYRRGVPTAWSMTAGDPNNMQKYIVHLEKMIQTMNKYNEYTNNKYAKELKRRTARYHFTKCILSKTARSFWQSEDSAILSSLPRTKKMLFMMAVLAPNITLKLYLNRQKKHRSSRF